LTKDSLFKVLAMANKKEKNQVSMWVDMYFGGANLLRGYNKDCISFSEYKELVIKSIKA
jgi:hypothetical protein